MTHNRRNRESLSELYKFLYTVLFRNKASIISKIGLIVILRRKNNSATRVSAFYANISWLLLIGKYLSIEQFNSTHLPLMFLYKSRYTVQTICRLFYLFIYSRGETSHTKSTIDAHKSLPGRHDVYLLKSRPLGRDHWIYI